MAGGGTERQGSRGCRLGGRAWRAQVSRWGGERGASCHLSEPTPTRPGQLPGPGRPRQPWLCVLGPAPWGLPQQFSSAYVRAPSSPGSPGPHPLPGAAAREPPPRHPVPPCALHTGSFRLGSPRSPCHPLGSPRSSTLHTHTPLLSRGSPLGSLLVRSFSFSKVSSCSLLGLPDPSSPFGPLPPLDPAGTVSRLEGRIPSWALGACLSWGSWEDLSGAWSPRSARVLCIQKGLRARSD